MTHNLYTLPIDRKICLGKFAVNLQAKIMRTSSQFASSFANLLPRNQARSDEARRGVPSPNSRALFGVLSPVFKLRAGCLRLLRIFE